MSCIKKINLPFLVSELLPFDFFFQTILVFTVSQYCKEYLDETSLQCVLGYAGVPCAKMITRTFLLPELLPFDFILSLYLP